MELIQFFAPTVCSRVPLIALEEIGVPYKRELVAFAKGAHRSPAYLALNPAGKVPVLVVDGKPIPQNSAIQIFLARAFPEAGLLPLTGDLVEDSQAIAKLVWFSADLHPLVNRIRIPALSCDAAPMRVREQASVVMGTQLRPVEQSLANQPWILGENFSVLDAYMQWVWFRITGAGFDTTEFPNLVRHYAQIMERPSVKRVLEIEAEADEQLKAEGLQMVFTAEGGMTKA